VQNRDFSPDKPCEAVHCEKHRHAFLQCEENYWVCLAVKNPAVHTTSGTGKDKKTSSEYLVTIEPLAQFATCLIIMI
jgi:hypothetical protein